MKQYKLTVFMKTGKKFVNHDLIDQKFVDAIYNCIADGKDMVLQVALRSNTAVMLSLKNVDYVRIDIK